MAAGLTAVIGNDHPFPLYFPEEQVIMPAHIPDTSLEEPFTHHEIIFI
jgi:hypothetical protein